MPGYGAVLALRGPGSFPRRTSGAIVDSGPLWALELDRWREGEGYRSRLSVAAIETLGPEGLWVIDRQACEWAEAILDAGFPGRLAEEEFLTPEEGTSTTLAPSKGRV